MYKYNYGNMTHVSTGMLLLVVRKSTSGVCLLIVGVNRVFIMGGTNGGRIGIDLPLTKTSQSQVAISLNYLGKIRVGMKQMPRICDYSRKKSAILGQDTIYVWNSSKAIREDRISPYPTYWLLLLPAISVDNWFLEHQVQHPCSFCDLLFS